jgi:glycine/D-amino acid oxidase-like deaminating enzyme/nitrite reductase/ring-hydroxylating ferredoxin subunit
MNVGDEKTKSLWMSTKVVSTAPKLTRNIKCDTVVIGSGIAGLSCAYELANRGQSVVVLDRGAIGSGMTARTTAHLTPICDDTFSSMLKLRGEKLSRLFYESQAAAVDRIEALCKEHAIACDFRRLDGFLFPALGADPREAKDELDTEHDAARKVGARVEKASGVPFKGLRDVRCLRYPRQATFHPLKYLKGLAALIKSRRGKLFAHTPAVKFEEDSDGVAVTTKGGLVVRAQYAIVATNSPVNDRVEIHSKQAPYRTYAMAFALARGALNDALYWDTADPYHYVRLNPGPGATDYLIVGGADHKSGEADDGAVRFEAIEAWIRGLLPDLGKEVRRWSGQVMDTIDYSGFIGKNPGDKNIYIVTGDSGQGMTHGALAGMLLHDLIIGGSSPWQEVYDPARKPASAVANFISENVTAVKNFAEYLAPGELKSLDELERGKGAIVRQGLTKIAAYRDQKGKLHQRSAKCTHLGCHLHWNSTEECWDCPCHGSQFSVDGEVLNGPAIMDLPSV